MVPLTDAIWRFRLLFVVVAVALTAAAEAAEPVETTDLAEAVAAGRLPPIEQRLPSAPSVVDLAAAGKRLGRHGGTLTTLILKAKDVKLVSVYGYARLVAYSPKLALVADILRDLEVAEGRVFTLRLRPGHRWSDGHPFTAEDFRYWWEDVANDPDLSPVGPPKAMMVDGEPPLFEVLDRETVRYSWPRPNPLFPTRLAASAALFIYRPAHYLKQFHAKYADPDRLAKAVVAARQQNWAGLHDQLDNLYFSNNPDLPTLQPWANITRPPAERFVAIRNPYFHRIDAAGRQLPYIDRMVLQVAEPKLIAAKTGTGESVLQARGLALSDYPFLGQQAAKVGYRVLLWRLAVGAHFALFPNLNAADPVWRKLLRDVRFRRALSLGIDRAAINQFLFYGQALAGNNTVLPESPLYRDEYRRSWADYDTARANALLDQIGLPRRGGIRTLPDGRALEIVAETAGEAPEQADILELIASDWKKLGIKLLTRPLQRELLRNRIIGGKTHLAVWNGLTNGIPTADMSPAELAPTSRLGLQWPTWGYHYETGGAGGAAPDMAVGQELLALYEAWLAATAGATRQEIWHRMLALHAEQVLTIGVIAGVPQPVVVHATLQNVPDQGIYNWEPGAWFGIYRPDTFWFDPAQGR